MDRAVPVPNRSLPQLCRGSEVASGQTNAIVFHVLHGAATQVPCDIDLTICFL